MNVDILAIAAHRDDIEQTCGGTLLKMAKLGRRTGVLDLTRGELGSRGSAESRAAEAKAAAALLKLSWREALDIPDGRVENTWENRVKVARVIRDLQPRVLILPYWKGRHPDHYTCSVLGYEAAFLAGLSKLEIPGSAASAHRPFKVVYASLYHDVRPTFVVDITEEFEAKLQSLLAYKEQFADQDAGRADFPPQADIRERLAAMAGFYGLQGGVKYAEPFVQKEIGLIDDLLSVPVRSI